ncbi:MAG: HAMP domain-containing histidine kinase, partial [Candidatus Marinimicrobia bacterium]|nr:HAMP domain-containing histidine kinase [Candidatus Neomarinimicrobiota bacterium]
QLGTPVSALLGWVDWLKEHPEKTLELIPEMEADLKRLEQIGRRFSKMGSEPEMENFDLSERVTRVVDYLNRRLPTLGKKVELVNDIHPGIMITANGSLLAWSIENIIRNGIDAIDRSDGRITISLKEDEIGVKIQIKDNGRGIPKKDWKNVFRPGFSTKKSGWGLGLSLSMRIVQDIHKGKLQIRDSIRNESTTFEISL